MIKDIVEKTANQIYTQTNIKSKLLNRLEERQHKLNAYQAGFSTGKLSLDIQKNEQVSSNSQIGIKSAKEQFKKLKMNGFGQDSKKSSRASYKTRRPSQLNSEVNSIVRNLKDEQQQQKNMLQNIVKNEQLKPQKLMKYVLQSQIKQSDSNANEYHKNKLIRIKSTNESNLLTNLKEKSFWLGQVYDRCTSSAFHHFTSRNLDYNQTKSYCCEQILSNILDQIRDTKSMAVYCSSKDMVCRSQSENKLEYTIQPMKFYNEESNKILGYLCSKYPQTNIMGANKQVGEIVETINIDNWANDEYDILRLSPVKFKYKQQGDYSEQIMLFLNFLMELPFKTHRKYPQFSNLRFFDKVMHKIFSIVYFKDTNNDLSFVLNEKEQFNWESSKQNLTQQEQQYIQKVKKYTSIQIGSKISGTAKHFSKQDVLSGIIKIEDNAVSRVIDKWVEQLGSKFFEAENNILNRSYRFKSDDNNKFNKIQKQSIDWLFQIMKEKKVKLQKFIKELKNSLYHLSGNLASNIDCDTSELHFIDQRQRFLGEFAVKMAQSSSQYFIQILQKQIGLLLESVQELKSRWIAKYKFKQSPHYQQLKINLITFKIGDLLRCKITSNQAQIARVLKLFITLNEMWENKDKLIRIIRVKNRLESGTRDVLINFMLDQICPCQIQLCVVEKIEQKQIYFDKFNHFLYELKRAYLGPIMEMCKIWKQYEGKSETYRKAIEKQKKKKIEKKIVSEQLKYFDLKDQYSAYEYKFPFICSSCQIFYPRAVNIYFTTLIFGKIYCGNCWVVKASLHAGTMAEAKKLYIFRKYLPKYPNFIKLVNNLEQLTSLSQLLDNGFQINIPIHSRIIHMEVSMSLKVNRTNSGDNQLQENQDEYAFLSTKITNQGLLTKQVCTGKIKQKDINSSLKSSNSIEQKTNYFDQNYIFYGWKMPTKLMPLPAKRDEHYFQMILKLMPQLHKLQQEKGQTNVKVCGVEVQKNKYYLLPFFIIEQQKLVDQVIEQINMQNITKMLKKRNEVVEIQNKNITNQFEKLPKNIKLKFAYTVKQIYLNQNRIVKLSFIQHLHNLCVVQANHNLIQEVPTIPNNLEQLVLTNNKIQLINCFFDTSNAASYNLKLLNLSYNSIDKISNIYNLQNLRTLFLIRNKIGKMEGFPKGLTSIALSFNQLQKIQGLDDLKDLKAINLAGNRIEKIQNLEQCSKLQTLMLSRNQIKKVQNLQKLENLTILHLNHTGLQNQHDESQTYYQGLKGLKNMKRLLLQGNKIKCLLRTVGLSKMDVENGLQNFTYFQMEEVSLYQNQIRYITGIQIILPYLKILNLKSNKITQISNIFHLSFLEEVDVSQNLISCLPETGWEKIFKVRTINLSNNKITRIPDLRPLLFIKNLNLENNMITEIENFPSWAFGQPDFARQINMSSNRLFCQGTNNSCFSLTVNAIKQLTIQSKVNMLNNGNCEHKIQKVQQIAQIYALKLKIEKNILAD